MVLGGFLTEYCRSWVPRTRLQLAARINAVCGLEVPEHRIREWQRGQAPGTGAELKGLLEVLRRDGVRTPELVEVFHATETAKLAASGWDDLHNSDNLAMSREIDTFAEDVYADGKPLSFPGTLALLHWLGRADEGALGPVGRRLRLKQARATVFLRCQLARRLEWSGRFGKLVGLARENAHLCADTLGNRNDGASPMFQRAVSAHAKTRAGDPAGAAELWAIHQALWALGPSIDAVATYLWSLDLWELLPPVAARVALERRPRVLALAERLDPHHRHVEPLLHLADLSRRQERWGELEGHLEAYDRRGMPRGLGYALWHLAAGDLCARTKERERAEFHYREARWESCQGGHRPQEERAVASLRALGFRTAVLTADPLPWEPSL